MHVDRWLRGRTRRASHAWLLASMLLVACGTQAADLTARQIVERAHAGDKRVFQVAFDGARPRDQHGPVRPERASGDEATAFGFSAIRFALQPGFQIERLIDDQVEGRPYHFVRTADPTGARMLFGIDQSGFAVRSAGWQKPKGIHQRLYSDGPRPGSADPSPTPCPSSGRV